MKIIFVMLLLISVHCLAVNNENVWRDNFDSATLSGWDYHLNPTGILLIKDPKNNDEYAASFTLSNKETWPNGHTRVELKHNILNSKENAETSFSLMFMTPSLFNHSNNIAYWESNNTYRQAFAFAVEPNNQHNELVFSTNFPKKKEMIRIPFNINEWHSLNLQIVWSEDPNQGRISLYYNDKKLIDNLHIQTKSDHNDMFIQMGLHRTSAKKEIDHILMKNVIDTSI